MGALGFDPSLISGAAVGALFSAVWEGTLLAAGALVCLRLMPRLSPASRSAVWMSVFSLAILLHFVPAFGARGAVVSVGHSFRGFHLDVRWSVAIAAVWAALSLWRGTQVLLSGIRLSRLARRSTRLPADAAIMAILQDWGTRRKRAVELCTSVEVERPCVFGFFRPRILIPPGLAEKLSALELQQVVLHEMEHLRRGDDWTNLLQKIGLALFPLNPVLLWVERRLCAERELACDDRVLRSSGARKAYAICLTHLAEYSMVRRSVSLALGAWERQSELVRRVQRLLRGPGQPMGGRRARLVTSGIILGVLGGALGLARSPELVSFTGTAQAMTQAHYVPPMDLRGTQFARASIGETGTSAQLVKAIMPTAQTAKAGPMTKTPRRSAARRAVKRPDIENGQAWLVLTDWDETVMTPHIVFAVAPGNRVSYEAVRIPNGWLIVQI